MMRLPTFAYNAPADAAEITRILHEEGPAAQVVAGGTDLFPNMKRRQVEPETVVSLYRATALRGIEWDTDGSLRIGPTETLRALERDARLKEDFPALHAAIVSISTPLLRSTGTLGGNLCLDTRCQYLNQNYEWRRAINHCLKCTGDTCWTAPGGTKCWAVNSSDSVPVMIAMGAKLVLQSTEGEREVDAEDFYDIEDGRDWLKKRPDELLTGIRIPKQNGSRSTYMKLRRRDAFDFPVLGVAATLETDGDVITEAKIVLNSVGPAPVRCTEAEQSLIGKKLTDEAIEEAKDLSRKGAKPLDNTDYLPNYRKKMVPVFVKRALLSLR